MGMIKIEVAGSFKPNVSKVFSALERGHAAAVAEAIAWLSAEVLPAAIRNDHICHAEGAVPRDGFAVVKR